MTMEEFKMGIKTQRIGRMAKTKSISLSPDQLADVMAFEELTGMELDHDCESIRLIPLVYLTQ